MDPFDPLPLGQLEWPRFEQLLVDVLEGVEGLSNVRPYGRSGQSQAGLDIIGERADGSVVGVQCKRYQTFSPSQLADAVTTFVNAERPFPVAKFVIATSSATVDKALDDERLRQQQRMPDVPLEVWGVERISRMLRRAPATVRRYFGEPTVQAFCDPTVSAHPVPYPDVDSVQLSDALSRTPEVETGAKALFDQAASLPAAEALPLVEEAQQRLQSAGFAVYSAAHEAERSRLLMELDRGDEAGSRIVAALWSAVDGGSVSRLGTIHASLHGVAEDRPSAHIRSLLTLVSAVQRLIDGPGALPADDELTVGPMFDRARLVLLAAEVAFAADDVDWIAGHLDVVSAHVEELREYPLLRLRLRLLIAEVTEDWVDLLHEARTHRSDGGLDGAALTLARCARHVALRERFREADALWEEAAIKATLTKRWRDAAAWTFSRRSYRLYWSVGTVNTLLSLQQTFRSQGDAARIVPGDDEAIEAALRMLREDTVGAARRGLTSARQALRDAMVRGYWGQEAEARLILGDLLAKLDDREGAAHQYAVAANSAGKKLLNASPDAFIDNLSDLTSGNYWTRGTALQLLATEADMIPDDRVPTVIAAIEAAIARADAGAPDQPAFAFSHYNGAVAALAGIAERLPAEFASRMLRHFMDQPPLDANSYRFHDENEARAVAGIAQSHPALASDAIAHLVRLLARSQPARNDQTYRTLDELRSISEPLLRDLAGGGDRWARDFLAGASDPHVADADASAAMERLSTPLKFSPGVTTVGTRAPEDAVLALGRPKPEIDAACQELVARGSDQRVAWMDRVDYLRAAITLAPGLSETSCSALLPKAELLAVAPTPTDESAGPFASPDSVTVDRSGRVRLEAIHLAAMLARSDVDRARLRSIALGFVRGQNSDRQAVRALDVLGNLTEADVAFLSGQGEYARARAAMAWADQVQANPESPLAHLGVRLAVDPHPLVRRSLARQVAEIVAPVAAVAEVGQRLADDPRFSVRRLIAP
ncbi:restriction endonuclease [Curtobacterium sp. Arg-1]|uniref:restriction endonuclease n=1 Tax=Curtobacterium sp. Arg-1 TaxID=2935040 RepID=UPI0021D89955|nr:hypothetical protein [Curtobacterium sp. Arg-1]UXZ56564.1 hypothetical protein MXD64_11010 [Curtobacterium sp. Arg-1]